MRPGRNLILALAAPGLALAVWLVGLALLIRAATGGGGVAVAPHAAGAVAAIIFGWWLAGLIAGAYAVRALWRSYVLAPARLVNAARIMATNPASDSLGPLPETSPPMLHALAGELEGLATQRRDLRAEMARLVDEASRKVAEQRDQLGALMAELDHAVVVCNLDGRILLYNDRARTLARRLAPAWTAAADADAMRAGAMQAGAGAAAEGAAAEGAAAEGAAAEGADAPRPSAPQLADAGIGTVGLGRSIHGLIDPAAIEHGLDTVANRLARGVGAQGAVAQFVTATDTGQLVQVSLSPVRPVGGNGTDDGGGNGGERPVLMTGYVLMLDDITQDQRAQLRRDQALQGMTEASRASVANMQAALEMLEFPDLTQPDRARFLAVVRDEVAAMGGRLAALTGTSAQENARRWPLQDMLGSDLAAAALRRLGDAAGAPVTSFPVAEDLWLRIDSFGLLQALDFLAAGIRALSPDPDLWLRLNRVGTRAHLDLGWRPRNETEVPVAALTALQSRPIGREDGPSVRDVVDRHGGEIWLERGRAGDHAWGGTEGPFFRMLLPLAAVESEGASAVTGARPEFYDFDLFAAGQTSAADDQPLANVSFTVFDCETTGLDPSGGDEIIQIGAVRILNGRILRSETIDQLVDPQRSIPEAGIPIHHIEPHMVRGKPTILQALPEFYRFAEGSVLVGHNVAFDMRFLKLKEAATGCVFDHPVLDTLLLSSIVHPAEDSHSLEAIAARLGITIGGRHTALGDALATAEVFTRLIPILARQGIVTLGQARAAAGRSQFARLKY